MKKWGTVDTTYDLVSVLYHALQGCETLQMYLDDAKDTPDKELQDFFKEVLKKYEAVSLEGKELLAKRLK